jgi:hypothetical protein
MFIKKRFAARRLMVVLWGSLMLLATAGTVSAQSPGGATISLQRREVTLKELFRTITKQSGSIVVFSTGGAILDRQVVLPATEGSVSQMLDAVLPGEELGWKMVNNYIVVGPARTEPVAVSAPVETPIRVAADQLRTFAEDGVQRAPDSVVVRTVERGPFTFTAATRRFSTPGTILSSAPSERDIPRFALKTNLLHGAVGQAPNIFAEISLSKRITLEAGYAQNGWNLHGTARNNRKMVHGGVTVEARHWTCERFNGHFVGVHALWRFYNVGGHDIPFVDFKRDYRYEGTAIGIGLSYGYSLPLGRNSRAEFDLGVGAARMTYKRYGCDKCADLEETVTRTYFGPTRAGVTLSFLIK